MMIDRYRDGYIRELFSENNRYALWRQLELDFLFSRRWVGDQLVTAATCQEAAAELVPSREQVMIHEDRLGHDVMGFLSAWTHGMSNATASQIHLGMTSSDVVDNVLFQQLDLAGKQIAHQLEGLLYQLTQHRYVHQYTVRPGRTHGQIAEPTTWGWRCGVWGQSARQLIESWHQHVAGLVQVLKTPGAVGTMALLGEDVARRVAGHREVELVPSTQVIPRWRMVAWAGWLAQVVSLCEEIALEIRLSSRSEVGEVEEGGAGTRIGSSSMPHKRNPVDSEQISGLARVARSHFAAIAETAGALHHERDISNSSVERLVVPDFAELTAYIVESSASLLSTLRIDSRRMSLNNNKAVPSSQWQFRLQRLGFPLLKANELARMAFRDGGWDYPHMEQQFKLHGLEWPGIDAFLIATDPKDMLNPAKYFNYGDDV